MKKHQIYENEDSIFEKGKEHKSGVSHPQNPNFHIFPYGVQKIPPGKRTDVLQDHSTNSIRRFQKAPPNIPPNASIFNPEKPAFGYTGRHIGTGGTNNEDTCPEEDVYTISSDRIDNVMQLRKNEPPKHKRKKNPRNISSVSPKQDRPESSDLKNVTKESSSFLDFAQMKCKKRYVLIGSLIFSIIGIIMISLAVGGSDHPKGEASFCS